MTGNYKITYKKGKLTVRKSIKVKVTLKVKHGAWNDSKSKSRTVTLTEYEGDSLKLAAKQIPAVGNKPAKGYKAGSWNKKPGIKTSLKKNTTYTYTYAKKPEPKPQEPTKKEKDKAALDAGFKATWNGDDVTVEFGKVSGATAYDVYASYCGEKFALYDTVSGGKVTVKKLKGRKLDASKTVKVCVAARDGKKQLARTITAHGASPANKYTNAKQVTISGKPFKVEKGKTIRIRAKLVPANGKKPILPDHHVPQFRYATGNRHIATVDKNGKVTGKGKGTCAIYVYAANGMAAQATVTVN